MNTQHCGRMTDHSEHKSKARRRPPVALCSCDERVCVCPAQLPPTNGRREFFRCLGVQVVEGYEVVR